MPLPSQFFFSTCKDYKNCLWSCRLISCFHDTCNLCITCLNLFFFMSSQKWVAQVFQLFTKRKRFKLLGYSGVKALTVACSKVASHLGPQSSLCSPTGTKQKRWGWRQGNTHLNILLQANNRWKQSFKSYCSNIPKQNAYVWVISAHPGTLWAS